MPQTPKTPGQPSKPSQASMTPRETQKQPQAGQPQKQPRTDQQGSGLRGAGRDTPPRKDDR